MLQNLSFAAVVIGAFLKGLNAYLLNYLDQYTRLRD